MESQPFYVHTRPRVFWDWDLREKNLRYLQSIDAGFYRHVATVNAPLLEDRDRRQYAAAAMRLAYGQAVEDFVALYCAMLQAPGCVVGWMLCYRPVELGAMARVLTGDGGTFWMHPNLRPGRLRWVAERICAQGGLSGDDIDRFARPLAQLWAHFMKNQSDAVFTAEYNALKHGMRPRLGGFSLRVGNEEEYGKPAEHMVSLGGSVFGSSFFTREEVADSVNLRPRDKAVNWSMLAITSGLEMCSRSIDNLALALRVLNGESIDDLAGKTWMPEDPGEFGKVWASVAGVRESSLDTRIGRDDIEPASQDKIREYLDSLPDVSS